MHDFMYVCVHMYSNKYVYVCMRVSVLRYNDFECHAYIILTDSAISLPDCLFVYLPTYLPTHLPIYRLLINASFYHMKLNT